EEYRSLYTECWDNDSEKRPTSEQCYNRLRNIIGELTQLPKCDSDQCKEKIKDHSLSDELSMLYNKLQLNGKSMKETADFLKNWLIQNSDKQESSLTILKAHTDCGQCFWLI